jgi:hypothetical protein
MSARYYCDNCNKEAQCHTLITRPGAFDIGGVKGVAGFDCHGLSFCEGCLLEFQRKHKQYDSPEVGEVAQIPAPKKHRKGIFG